MKVRTFQKTDSRPDTVINALGWTKEYGLAWIVGHRSPLATLEEAEKVLKIEPEVVVENLRKRVVNRVRGFLLGY